MKVGKYPVKHSYKISRLIADILTVGLMVLICSGVLAFFTDYEMMLDLMRIGQDNIQNIVENYDSSILWRQWLILGFPLMALAVVAVYLVLTLKSHSFKKYSVNKRNAQKVYDEFAFGVSLCKLPALIIIYDLMCGTYDRLLPFPKYGFALFSWSSLLYVLLIVIIIRFTMHRISRITEKAEPVTSNAVKVKSVAVEKPAKDEKSENNKEDI